MKICINQVAFVAIIMFVTTTLNSTTLKAVDIKTKINTLNDQVAKIHNQLSLIAHLSDHTKTDDQYAQKYNLKDKSLTGKQRAKIQELQRNTVKNKSDLRSKVNEIEIIINNLSKKVESIAQSTQDKIDHSNELFNQVK